MQARYILGSVAMTFATLGMMAYLGEPVSNFDRAYSTFLTVCFFGFGGISIWLMTVDIIRPRQKRSGGHSAGFGPQPMPSVGDASENVQGAASRDQMGQDIKGMYDRITVALDGAQDAKDALFQFASSQGYRLLRKDGLWFLQDLQTAKVYQAEFARPEL